MIRPARTDYYIEKRETDRSTLYSFDGPFQLFHADVGDLEFLGKNTTFPSTALRCGSFSKKISKKRTSAIMIRIIFAFANQIFL